MDLISVTNAPVGLTLAGSTFRARSLTLGQIGEVLAWLKDRLPDEAVLFSSEASRIALATTEGLSVLLHLSCVSCHPGMSRDEANRLAATMSTEDEAKLLSVAFRRLPGKPADPDSPPAKDLAEVNWWEIFEYLTGHRADAFEGAASLSLDQFDCFVSKGEGGDPDSIDPKDVQAMWDAAQPAEAQPEAPTSV